MSRPRRRRIEIYFVLYLVALVLLLPERPQQQGTHASVPTDLRLDLQPERVRLECTLIRAAEGTVRVHRIDSTNVIRYSSELEDVQVRARVEDLASGQVLNVESGSAPNALFELLPQPERQAVVFRWRPNLQDGAARTLRVTVTGSARLPMPGGPNAADNDRLPVGLRINGSTQFVLATMVTDETGAPFQQGQSIVDTLRIVQQDARGMLGQFWMEAAREQVTAAPLQSWSMRISMGGADPLRDLSGMPAVRTNVNGIEVERFLDTAARTLVVRGKAPRLGSYTVTVTARRRDGQQAETAFQVRSTPLAVVNIVDVMYPGLDYTIDPQLPDVAGAEAVILDGQREIVSVRSGKMHFTPKSADTGSTLFFVRLIDGERAEPTQPIHIRAYPAPEIRDVKDFSSGDRKKIIVKFYGDRNKDRPSLDLIDGNARTPRKLFGNIHAADANENPTFSWIEEFEISRKDASRPFTFVIVARSPSGRTSAQWKE